MPSRIQQVGSSVASQSDIQKWLTSGHWKDQYSEKYKAKGAKGGEAKPYAELMKPDYWDKYSDNNTKGKSNKGGKKSEGRDAGKVKELIPELNKELEARANQPSLVLYKSLPIDRKELGGHFGDYDHAKSYYDGNSNQQQKMLKFTLKPGAHELLFSPKYMALSPKRRQARPLAELSKLKGEGPYPLASGSEGYLGGYIGSKPEGDSGFSLGFKEGNKASEALFRHFVSNIEEGRPGKDGKVEPSQQNSPRSPASHDAESAEN